MKQQHFQLFPLHNASSGQIMNYFTIVLLCCDSYINNWIIVYKIFPNSTKTNHFTSVLITGIHDLHVPLLRGSLHDNPHWTLKRMSLEVNFFFKKKRRSKHRNILKWKVLSPLTGLTWEVEIPYKGLWLLILSKLQVGAHQDSTTPIIFILHLCFCIIFPKFDSIKNRVCT